MTAIDTLDRLYSVRELWELGYGSKNSIRALIADGVVPAVKVGNRFKVRESDLYLIAVPVTPRAVSA
ncbi:hypothetical protein [Brevibacterium casei]|uniref:hypothetical protein n=1 Tax=Brevibacterium casei TaxID=33889 RepID=UPI0028A9BA5E|nr:hypothetical protein [Brevibacterium casei]